LPVADHPRVATQQRIEPALELLELDQEARELAVAALGVSYCAGDDVTLWVSSLIWAPNSARPSLAASSRWRPSIVARAVDPAERVGDVLEDVGALGRAIATPP
jgi:hypothetical protein